MAKDPRVEGYAKALFDIAQAEGVLDQVEDELFRFARTLENEIRLRDALVDPQLPVERRVAMLRELLGEKASPHTINLISFIVEQGRAREITRIIDAMVELAAHERQRAVAEVRTAVPLDDEQRARLERALRDATRKEITLKVIIDPSVMGGLVARVGDMVFDASVRRRLELAKEEFGRG
jgi:F-type H+-transporting ATPase subunit delta